MSLRVERSETTHMSCRTRYANAISWDYFTPLSLRMSYRTRCANVMTSVLPDMILNPLATNEASTFLAFAETFAM